MAKLSMGAEVVFVKDINDTAFVPCWLVAIKDVFGGARFIRVSPNSPNQPYKADFNESDYALILGSRNEYLKILADQGYYSAPFA
jgi:hypothetical protein